jgi:hypothetical protein
MLLALVFLAPVASAQSFVEAELRHTPDGLESQMCAWVVSDLTPKRDALTVWALATRSWGEVLVGYQYQAAPWLTLGAGAGMETHRNVWRVNPWAFAAKGKYSLFLTVEEGASGLWYRAEGGYRFSERVTAGIFSRRFTGTGPYLQVTILPKTSVFATVAHHHEGTQALVALRRSF